MLKFLLFGSIGREDFRMCRLAGASVLAETEVEAGQSAIMNANYD